MEQNENQEDKKSRFKRLAEYRTNKVLKRLRVLGNCSNKSSYEYASEDVSKMFSVIEEELQRVKSKFKNPKKEKFKF